MGILLMFGLTWLMLINFSHSCSLQWCEDTFELFPPGFPRFQQHTSEFWKYDKSTGSWTRIDITKFLHSSRNGTNKRIQTEIEIGVNSERLSLMKLSESSFWITGYSGSIYERFWNNAMWVIIPHDLPTSMGHATSVYSVNRTMLARSDTGKLYQLQVDMNGQVHWTDSGPLRSSSTDTTPLKKSAVLSSDGASLFFSSTDGCLFELCSLHPLRWTNHSSPRGADVAQVVDAGGYKAGIVFTVSTNGDLYEYDKNAKPAWRKHIRSGSPIEEYELAPFAGVPVHDFAGILTFSLFLMTKTGVLVERRLAQAKWRWILHAQPDTRLGFSVGPTVIKTSVTKDNGCMKNISFFFASQQGSVYEYTLPFLHGNMRSTSNALQNGSWTNHHRPEGARLIPSVPGIVFNTDRLLFLLQDGRLAELHIHGLGGVRMGPISRTTTGKKQEAGNYVWSIIDAPESEGGNAEYCSPNPGPLNCLEGTNDEFSFLNPLNHHQETFTGKSLTKPWQGTTRSLFQIRTLQFGKSIFFLGKDGVPSERFFNNNGWLWLKHEYSGPPINGILAIYNGTVFMNDEDGNMLLREWHGDKLHWFNSSSLQGGEKVCSGSPSDGLLGDVRTVTLEDAQFFVSQSGDLLEFMVAMRNFSWKNCGHPPETSVSAIIDQENLRYRVIFVVGSNGKLYQFNRITRHWFSEFNQPKHLNLSRIPGTVYRPSFHSTSGSLLMRSQNGNLVEFGWDPRLRISLA